MAPTLIYCADGNRRFAEIAIRRGYLYGAQLPNTVYFPPAFTDQDWRGFKKAKTAERRAELRKRYFDTLERYRPRLATVLDWELPEQLLEVLDWAEQAAQWVTEAVIIIPKVVGGIKQLPREIGGKQVRLGYSAASSFSGTPVSLGEFRGWPVHCLGGSVSVQMHVARTIPTTLSADGNYIQQQARSLCQFYSPSFRAKNNQWPKLSEAGIYTKHDSPYLAFELTCIGVPMAWNGANGQEIWQAQLAYLDSIGQPRAVQETLFSTTPMKCCSKCERMLPLSQFYPKDRTRLRDDCRECYNLYRSIHYAESPKRVRPLRTPEQREQHRIASRRARLAKVLQGYRA